LWSWTRAHAIDARLRFSDCRWPLLSFGAGPDVVTAKVAIFRADAGRHTGAGHLVRCLTLADALVARGWGSSFAVNEKAIETVPALAGEPTVVPLPAGREADAAAVRALVGAGCDLLVVDHYGLGADYEAKFRPWAQCILAIDDTADRSHDCDLLLDYNVERTPNHYVKLVPRGAGILAGPLYALLRSDFAAKRASALARRMVAGGAMRRIFVAMGATDPDNATCLVLKAIALSRLPVMVDLMLSAAAPHLDEVLRQMHALPQPARLHLDTSDAATLMMNADLAIGAAGITALERCSLGLPSVVVTTAQNQQANARGLQARGAIVLAGSLASVSPQDLADVLQSMNEGQVVAMSMAAAKICDGFGAVRVADTVTGLRDETITLRPVAETDLDLLFAWRNDETTRRASRSANPIERCEHAAWFVRALAEGERTLCVAEWHGAPVGVVRLDSGVPAPELSWMIAPEARGRGIATHMLRRMLARAPSSVVAHVRKDNQASQRVAIKAGLSLQSESREWMIFGR
jgi:UDP-2,4-diacetamido-2,4,6-trideoxy-beta-L-altropyranose hydrolase